MIRDTTFILSVLKDGSKEDIMPVHSVGHQFRTQMICREAQAMRVLKMSQFYREMNKGILMLYEKFVFKAI